MTLFGHHHRISRVENVLGSIAKARNRQNCGQVVGLQTGDALISIARGGGRQAGGRSIGLESIGNCNTQIFIFVNISVVMPE
jgi:hypothetical protein